MKFLWFLPNTFTFLNLFFGCIAVVFGVKGDLNSLVIFVLLGLVCDFLDGFFARILNVKSKIGVHLDSLSDLVTFGLTSSIVMFTLLSNSNYIIESNSNSYIRLIPYLSFLIAIASSYRLAKFNLDNHDSHFNGLPTPANALLIIFLPYVFEIDFLSNYVTFLQNSFNLIFIIIISSYLLISNLEMPSLKLKGFFTTRNNFNGFNNRDIFLIISGSLLIGFKLAAFPIIIIIYILLSLFRIKF